MKSNVMRSHVFTHVTLLADISYEAASVCLSVTRRCITDIFTCTLSFIDLYVCLFLFSFAISLL